MNLKFSQSKNISFPFFKKEKKEIVERAGSVAHSKKMECAAFFSPKKLRFFRSQKQLQLFLLLVATSCFSFTLFAYRLQLINFDWGNISNLHDLMIHRGDPTFIFLNWNLFLAWIPYLIAISLAKIHRAVPSKIITTTLLVIWLLFLPNAPYLLTDLLHLKKRVLIPMWFDVMMFVSFAWTGLLLGYLSLFEVQLFLGRFFKKSWIWVGMVITIFLCGFGIYLGRFQRWNSWDILADPFTLFADIIEKILHPFDYTRTLGLAVVLSVFLLLGYLTLITLSKSETSNRL